MRRATQLLLIGVLLACARILSDSPPVSADEPMDLAARQAELQRKYPFESLRERLAYEQLAPKRLKSPATSRDSSAENDSSLYNGITVFSPRIYSLRLLHYATTDEFSRVLGNGEGRMPRMSPTAIIESRDRERIKLIKLDGSVVKPSALGPEKPLQLQKIESQRGNPGRAPSLMTLGLYQYECADHNFCARGAFGYFESVDRVAGFIPHQFFQLPELDGPRPQRPYPRAEDYNSEFDAWRTTQLQLVSLLKQPEPRVYLSPNLPAMSELVNAETRELNAFENESLEKLLAGENLITAATTNTIRMLGALRARHECLECHSVSRGTLLGAFSYVLERDPPVRAEKLIEFVTWPSKTVR